MLYFGTKRNGKLNLSINSQILESVIPFSSTKIISLKEKTYHLTSHAINKHILFKSSTDEAVFLSALFYYSIKYGVKIISVVLLDNHYHLLVAAPFKSLISALWQQTNSAYAAYFNSKYNRKGSLFENVTINSKKEVKTLKHLVILLKKYFPKNKLQAKKRISFFSIASNYNNNKNTLLLFIKSKVEKKLENLLTSDIPTFYKIRISFLLNFIKQYIIKRKRLINMTKETINEKNIKLIEKIFID